MIKKRNLDNSLIQWIMTVTGVGPGIGEMKWLVPAASSTSQYRTQLQEMGIDDADMFTDPVVAEGALTANRNDVLLCMPAASHLMTAAITWDKNNTHLIGLAGPNMHADWRTGIRFRTATASIAALFEVQGHGVQFHNVAIVNHGNNAANKAALKLSYGHSFYAKGCHFRGARESTQASQTDCCSVLLHSGSSGSPEGAFFDDCRIGCALNPAHSGYTLGFTGSDASPARNVRFRKCIIEDQINTAATNSIGLVEFATLYSADRFIYFDDCLFYNFVPNWSDTHSIVFHFGVNPTTRDVILHNCTAVGFAEWQDKDLGRMLVSDMPAADTGGGLVRAQTASAYAGTDR